MKSKEEIESEIAHLEESAAKMSNKHAAAHKIAQRDILEWVLEE